MSSKINLQTCEYARKSSIFQDNQLIYLKNIEIVDGVFPVSIIRGYEMKNEICRPHGFYFENIVVHDKKIETVNDMRMVVELSNDIEFR